MVIGESVSCVNSITKLPTDQLPDASGSPPERRPRFVYGRRDRESGAVFAVRADRSLRAAPRARGRGGACRRARARRRAPSRARGRSAADRRIVAHLGRVRPARSRPRRRRDSVDLRAGAEHDFPVARARLGRGARRPRHRHRRQRARLLRLSRLPAGVHRARSSASPTSRRARASKAAGFACTRRSSRSARRTSSGAGCELGLDYGLTHSCYDPAPDGRPCGTCDSCVLRAKGFGEAGVPDPLLLR